MYCIVTHRQLVRDTWFPQKTQTWKNATFEPHLFLKFSSIFDSLINDTLAVKEVLQYILNGDAAKNHVGLKAAWEYAIKAFNTTERNTILR